MSSEQLGNAAFAETMLTLLESPPLCQWKWSVDAIFSLPSLQEWPTKQSGISNVGRASAAKEIKWSISTVWSERAPIMDANWLMMLIVLIMRIVIMLIVLTMLYWWCSSCWQCSSCWLCSSCWPCSSCWLCSLCLQCSSCHKAHHLDDAHCVNNACHADCAHCINGDWGRLCAVEQWCV